METIVENGHVEEAQYAAQTPRLQAGQLRRLSRMGAGVEGATEVAQAAIAAHNQRRQAYQQAFEAACEDVGIQIPAGEHDAQIDWSTGEVRFVPRQ
jgi:hypothetical protein